VGFHAANRNDQFFCDLLVFVNPKGDREIRQKGTTRGEWSKRDHRKGDQ
jgi:hypothetical protein